MAVAYVSAQSGVNTSSSSGFSTFTLTLGTAVSAGSTVCVHAGGVPSGGALVNWTITDNGSGNTYNLADNLFSSALGFETGIYYATNVQGSPTVLTLNAVSGTIAFPGITALTFTGVSIVSPLDGEQNNEQGLPGPGTGANAITSGSFSPATSGDLIVGFTANVASTGGDTAGTGFTLAINDAATYFSEYILSGVSGAQAATFTNATHGGDAGGAWMTSGMALKAAVPTTLSPPKKQWAWVGNVPAINHGLSTVQKQWQWVGNAPALLTGTTLQTVQKAWAWVGHAPTLTISQVIQTIQKQWAWAGNAPTLLHAIQTVQKAWAWVGHIPTLNKALATTQKQWAWVGNVPTLVFSTIINPPKAMWAWVARAPILSGGNIPHKVKEAFNVIRPILWGVMRGTLTWPTIGPEQ